MKKYTYETGYELSTINMRSNIPGLAKYKIMWPLVYAFYGLLECDYFDVYLGTFCHILMPSDISKILQLRSTINRISAFKT